MTDPTLRIFQLATDDHRAAVRAMWVEYLTWACTRIEADFGIVFDVPAMIERDMEKIDIFAPPHGRLLLAAVDDRIAACASMKRSTERIAEIKRMYVRPDFRQQGIGRALLDALIAAARDEGYHTIRLDSNRFMTEAHALYRGAGFADIDPYPESEIPQEYWDYWVFMERLLEE